MRGFPGVSGGLVKLVTSTPVGQLQGVSDVMLSLAAVKVKVTRRRFPSEEPEVEIEGRVEFISQGQLLPYDTRSLLQQWMLINESCGQRLTRSGRSLLYVLTGDVQADGTVSVKRIFQWHKRDTQLTLAVRKWRHHKC